MVERVSRKQIAEQIMSIKNATETIKVALDQMADCGAKRSLTVTYDALNKKVEKYSQEPNERFHLSEEEKEYILQMRAQKQTNTEAEISEVSTNNDSESSSDSVVEHEEKKSKKNKRNN